MWRSSLFRWTVILDVVFVMLYAYVYPTIMKAMGQQWSVKMIAAMSLAGTLLSLLQAGIAKWVSPRIILYGGCVLSGLSGIGILLTASLELAFALYAVRIGWIVVGLINQNWDALQWEALAKHGMQARMRTMLGSICSGAALLGSLWVFIYPPGLCVAIILVGGMELIGVAFSWIVAGKVLEILEDDGGNGVWGLDV